MTRIKNYKGSDLVDIAVQKNKSDVLNEFDKGGSEEGMPDMGRVETLAYRFVEEIQRYMKAKGSGKEQNWNEEKKWLGELCGMAK